MDPTHAHPPLDLPPTRIAAYRGCRVLEGMSPDAVRACREALDRSRPPPTGGRGVAAIAHDAREVMSRTSSSVARRTWPAAMPPPTTAPNRLGAVARSHRRTKCSSVR